MVSVFSVQHMPDLESEHKKVSTPLRLGFETRTIFMSCLLSRHTAAWRLQFQNFSITSFVWTRLFQSTVESWTNVAIRNLPARRLP